MKIHKSVSETLRMVLGALMESGQDGAPVFAMPGTYHGRPCTAVMLLVDDDKGKLAPLAVVLDPESDDAAYLTIEGAEARGSVAPSAPQGVPAGRVLDVLEVLLGYAASKTTDGARPVEHMRDARALIEQARRPAAPAAPLSTGMYL